MNKLLLVAFLCLFVAVSAQWNNNGQQFPNFPNIDCSAPGANCQSTQQVCDSKGNCKTTKSGSNVLTSTRVVLLGCGLLTALRMYQ
jgi:hypothetical protein